MIYSRHEVCQLFQLNKYTVANYAKGYYFEGGEKVYYFPDHHSLPFTRNELGRPYYKDEDVTTWTQELRARKK